MLAANRVGKTEGVGGYEAVLHLTGLYPDWWPGRRFTHPIKAWAAGDTHKSVREIIQEKLLGTFGDFGTGLIPGDCVIRWGAKTGLQDAVDTVYVTHHNRLGQPDGESVIVLKSYDQKRIAFQGTEQHLIWLDEEPPLDIYTECLMRTMTVRGLVLCTFTPLMGMSETVLHFLPGGSLDVDPDKPRSAYVINATWDDAPHLSTEDKEELWKSLPPHQRDARSKGVPQLGAGAIFPVAESDIKVDDFQIPAWWPRFYALDVGWNCTAAAWFARNPDTGVTYIYSIHKQGAEQPAVHAQAFKARGEWIHGAIDPASRGRSQNDGTQLYQDYVDLGLKLDFANNAVEAGLYQVWQALSSGQLKVFASCGPWFEEYRLYRRDDKGRVVKSNDHLMDATRYGWATRDDIETWPKDAKVEKAVVEVPGIRAGSYHGHHASGWMAG